MRRKYQCLSNLHLNMSSRITVKDTSKDAYYDQSINESGTNNHIVSCINQKHGLLPIATENIYIYVYKK